LRLTPILIDTDVLIDHFHGHRAALEYFAQVIATGETLAVSVVTLAEIASGMRPGEEARTEHLLSLFTVLDVNETIAWQSGMYLRQFRRSHSLELADVLIAATAACTNAELITRNLKHYPMTDILVTVPYERGSQPV
jgi:predicted nucleic acid-binding protein